MVQEVRAAGSEGGYVMSVFERTFEAARSQLQHAEPDTFAIWAIGYLQGIDDRERRWAALDAIMAAMDPTRS